MPGMIVLNPQAVDGYGNPLQVRFDSGINAYRLLTDTRITSIDSTVTTSTPASATGTLANVAGSTSSVTLIASNTARLGATIFNDSTSILYVKFGSTASATSFTVRMVSNAYYEVPYNYNGIITGIWVSATGNARVTELTA
jgi:hypothetical protein